MPYPLIAGQMPSWAELALSVEIDGGPSLNVEDLESVDFSDTLTPGRVKGAGGRTIGNTVGEHEADGQIVVYYARAVSFERALKLQNPLKPLGTCMFDLALSWTPMDFNGEIFTVRLVGCRIMSRQVSVAQGPDPLKKTYPLFVTTVEDNGIPLFE